MAQDVQILPYPVADAPNDWLIPDALTIMAKAVTAVFDGAGAGAAFLPTLDIISDSGHLVARVPTDTAVAAGGAAEVTFAPFLKGTPAATPASVGTIYATTPQVLPIFASEAGPLDFVWWSNVRIDNTIRSNAALTNQWAFRNADIGDYTTRKVTLGPQGSLWGVILSYKERPDGGKFLLSLASVASPNPSRPLPNAGSLTDNALTYVSLAATVDTYGAAAGDGTNNGTLGAFRMLGTDGTAFTTRTAGGDAYTGAATINGGAGVYELKLEVTGKRVASTGYVCDLTYLAMVRLDDNGYF